MTIDRITVFLSFRSAKRKFLALLLFVVCAPLFAAQPVSTNQPYLVSGAIDGIAILAPPPEFGSQEQAADLQLSRSVIKSRTSAEAARATKDASLAFSIFNPVIGEGFELTNYPAANALLKKVRSEIGVCIDQPKDYWQRLRPYQIDPSLSYGKPVAGFSYPSGHSTRGTVYSLILAEIFPEKKDAILEMGLTIGWDRVLIGKHFLTDVRAGRVLGRAIVRQLKSNPSFLHDLAAAQAEAKTKALTVMAPK